MDSIGAVMDRKTIPALVRFERRPVEDKAASVAAGRYVAKDVDYAIITPPYSKDEQIKKVTQFLDDNEVKVTHGKISPEQAEFYKKQYEAWKRGQELPLVGTPIRGWSVISPAQQEMLIRLNIPTVEYLAEINDEGTKAVGMGALDLKRKAKAWLAQAQDKGPLTQQMAAIQAENDVLKGSVESLMRQLDEVKRMLPTGPMQAAPEPTVSIADVLAEETEPSTTRKRKG